MQLWGIQDTFYLHRVDSSTFLILCVTNKRFWCPCLCSDLKQHYDGWSAYSALMLKLELFQKWNSIQVPSKLLQAVTRELSLQLNAWLRWGQLVSTEPCEAGKKRIQFCLQVTLFHCSRVSCTLLLRSTGCLLTVLWRKQCCSAQVGCSWAAGGEWGTACGQGSLARGCVKAGPTIVSFLFCF